MRSLCPFPSVSPTGKPYSRHIPTLDELLTVLRGEVAARNYDIAAINLVCCADLPGAEHVDVPAYLAKLDEWAAAIRVNTARSWHIYRKHPGDFGDTENQFRAIWMCYRMLKDYGVHYCASQHGRDNWSFGDPDNEFICGALGPKKTGTCACLPVLAVGVGRRLGFPLYLVSAPNHLFFRWEDAAERFNVEWSGEGGKTELDEHYYEWPVKWTEAMYRYQETSRHFLINKTPAQEFFDNGLGQRPAYGP